MKVWAAVGVMLGSLLATSLCSAEETEDGKRAAEAVREMAQAMNDGKRDEAVAMFAEVPGTESFLEFIKSAPESQVKKIFSFRVIDAKTIGDYGVVITATDGTGFVKKVDIDPLLVVRAKDNWKVLPYARLLMEFSERHADDAKALAAAKELQAWFAARKKEELEKKWARSSDVSRRY